MDISLPYVENYRVLRGSDLIPLNMLKLNIQYA